MRFSGEFIFTIDSPHARPFASKLAWRSLTRRVGRVIDRAGLEIRYTLFGYRGFESLTLRQDKQKGNLLWFPFLFYSKTTCPVRPFD